MSQGRSTIRIPNEVLAELEPGEWKQFTDHVLTVMDNHRAALLESGVTSDHLTMTLPNTERAAITASMAMARGEWRPYYQLAQRATNHIKG